MIAAVTAIALNRRSGRRTSSPGTEVIDTRTNRLFAGIETTADVKARYESWWNDLNPRSREVVRVLNVLDLTLDDQPEEREGPAA